MSSPLRPPISAQPTTGRQADSVGHSAFPPARTSPLGRIGLVLLLASLIALPGCGGCWKPETAAQKKKREDELKKRLEEEKKRREEEAKPPYEFSKLYAQPFAPKADRSWCKPGHWTAFNLEAKANKFTMYGDLEATVVDLNVQSGARRLQGLPHTWLGSRPMSLTKGQPKLLETTLFVPPSDRAGFVDLHISPRRGTSVSPGWTEPVVAMPSYQYHMVVLARSPDSYRYLKKLNSVKMPTDLTEYRDMAYYRITCLDGTKRMLLPSAGLYWTSVAVVFWDDADPTQLTHDQQVAMLDWLHWGGLLVISGPDSLQSLSGSFLKPYLPATAGESSKLSPDDLADLSVLPDLQNLYYPLKSHRSWSGVTLQKTEGARDVLPAENLVVDRRAGRGRVVVTAFRLNERALTNWAGFDEFFNAVVLGRPPRVFSNTEEYSRPNYPYPGWQQPPVKEAPVYGPTTVTWAGAHASRFDPKRICNLHYFSRDHGRDYVAFDPEAAMMVSESEQPNQTGSDVASWNDFSLPANHAREALTSASRIEAPPRSFVFSVVGWYLAVLVPLNWLVFRALGRVEWAWVAAPIIAVVCTGMVIRLARLDIGFVRAMCEIDVVELQGEYSRAHVTRYLALYSSLSTDYQFRSEDTGAQMLPFSTREALREPGKPTRYDQPFGQSVTRLFCRSSNDVTLSGFRVSSNSTNLAHAEQMLDLGGPVTLQTTDDGKPLLVNRTGYTLQGAGVMRRFHGTVEIAWAGDVAAKGEKVLEFVPLDESRMEGIAKTSDLTREKLWSPWQDRRDMESLTNRDATPGSLNVAKLVKLAEQPSAENLPEGETRLIAWTDEVLPGIEVRPLARQQKRAALVVAHLGYSRGPIPQPDANSPAKLKEEEDKRLDDDAQPEDSGDPGMEQS